MPAAYDDFDYPTYWKDRKYEHESDIHALKSFLDKIEEINTILELGVGFGRLTPTYVYRAKKAILSDPSARLLKKAKDKLNKYENIKYIHAGFETLGKKLRSKTADVAILVRVLHHIEKPQECFSTINRLLKDKGYFILEYANKSHFKAFVKEFLKGNFTYPLNIFTKDISSKKGKQKSTLPFCNFHPHRIEKMLKEEGFEIIEKRSVSNIRNPIIKKLIPASLLISIEKLLQKPLASLNFGPSIFILARKRG